MSAVLVWLGKASLIVAKWAIMHPIAAIFVGIGLTIAGQWLRKQPWAGADVMADLTTGVGAAIGVYGIGGWIAKQIVVTAPMIIRAAGRSVGDAFVALTTTADPNRWITWSMYWRP